MITNTSNTITGNIPLPDHITIPRVSLVGDKSLLDLKYIWLQKFIEVYVQAVYRLHIDRQ